MPGKKEEKKFISLKEFAENQNAVVPFEKLDIKDKQRMLHKLIEVHVINGLITTREKALEFAKKQGISLDPQRLKEKIGELFKEE